MDQVSKDELGVEKQEREKGTGPEVRVTGKE